ncbi:hypothetical protein [Nisaea sediminum]|uniref:hypothetical protein n=1 Tax=Nisaea sediminum TaxID=2775867 RepID=UPI001867C357|nr:hypothetical protein [Nisaea sediminum]
MTSGNRVETVDRDGYVEFVVRGFVDPDEVVAAIGRYYSGAPQTHSLWNNSEATLSTFTPDSFARIAAEAGKYLHKRGKNPRTAILVNTAAENMLIKAFSARAETVAPLDIRVFGDREAAVAWLQSRIPAD